jgi:hypothetical protein
VTKKVALVLVSLRPRNFVFIYILVYIKRLIWWEGGKG